MQAVRMRITDMRTSLSNPAAIVVKPAIAANTRAGVLVYIGAFLFEKIGYGSLIKETEEAMADLKQKEKQEQEQSEAETGVEEITPEEGEADLSQQEVKEQEGFAPLNTDSLRKVTGSSET